MKQSLKLRLQRLFAKFDLGVVRYSTLQALIEKAKSADDIELLSALPAAQLARLFEALPRSRAQLRQDLFVLSELDFKKNGFFVEFGATNGLDLSNTYLLERDYGWTGILAEPARYWHAALRANRTSHIETDCVWASSGSVLTFEETSTPELSTISTFGADLHSASRQHHKKYEVKTISLADLLAKYEAPNRIDFMSIDTEGSEFEILKDFDFNEYSFSVIACEHNFTPVREKIAALLAANGYVRKLEQFSKFDDWYVRA